MTYHCMFEQSGTFKNVFKELGFNAIDYDIENSFNETDVVIDIFKEIDKYYRNELSIFSNINKEDVVIAFFPCTYFSIQNNLIYTKKFRAFSNWTEQKINDYIKERLSKRDLFYKYLIKFTNISLAIGYKLIIENPYSGNYLLTKNHKPDLIIKNRLLFGDYFKKPTMFYILNGSFFNNNVIIPEIKKTSKKISWVNKGIQRSIISYDFAKYFITNYIIKSKNLS